MTDDDHADNSPEDCCPHCQPLRACYEQLHQRVHTLEQAAADRTRQGAGRVALDR